MKNPSPAGTRVVEPDLQPSPGAPLPVRTWEIAFLVLLLGAVAASCWPWMTTLGLENDEAHFLPTAVKIAVGSPEKVHFPSGLYLFHRPFPFMTAAFIGAFDGYLYGLVFAVFGISVLAFRVTNLVLSLLLLTATYGLARSLWGRGAAVAASLLLALDLEFLLHAPTNYGPIHIQMLCGALSVLLLHKWLHGGPQRYLVLAALLLGLAFTEKLTFVLFLGSLAAALPCLYARAVLARLTFRVALLGVAAFLIGCLPVLICTAGNPGVVVGFGRANTGSPVQWAAAITQRYAQWKTLLTGQSSAAMMTGATPGLGRFSVLWWGLLMAYVAIVAAAAAGWWRPSLRNYRPPRRCTFLAVLCAGIVGLSALFPESGRIHHLMLTYPFVHCLVAMTFTWMCALAFRKGRMAGFLVLGATALPLAATAGSTVLNLRWFTQETLRTGGRNHWSSEIYDLAAWVRNKPDTHFVLPSWGLYRPLFTLTGGSCSCREFYFQLLAPGLSPGVKAEARMLLRRRNSVLIFSRILPEYTEIKSRLFDLALEIGLQPKLLAQFHHRREGRPLFEAYALEGSPSLAWSAAPLGELRIIQASMRDLSLSRRSVAGSASFVLQGTTDDTANPHVFGVELPLTAPVRNFRFRAASSGWDCQTDLSVHLLGADGEILATWERPFQWYPIITRELFVELGPDLYPDYFLYAERGQGVPKALRIVTGARGRRAPAGLAVSELQAGQPR